MNIELINLLHKRTKIENDHWLWDYTLIGKGYGQVRYNNNLYLIHRLSLCIYLKLEYKDDWKACHICEYKNCWNPLHLYQGTQKDNTQDAITKGNNHNKNKTHCSNGHEFTKENTYQYRNSRYCLACKRRAKKDFELRALQWRSKVKL